MTKKRLAVKSLAMAMAFAMACPVLGQAGTAYAAETDPMPDVIKGEGYHLVWNDEFDGTSLNTDDWNIEKHPAGWVNAELQSYGDPDNIEVSDGTLKLIPKAEKKESSGETGPTDVLNGAGFDGWDGGNSFSEGTATVVIDQAYENAWDKQFQKAGLTLKEGHNYKITFKASALAERKIAVNVANTEDYSKPIASKTFTVGTEETEITVEFTAGKVAEGKAAIQINLGKIDDSEAGGAQTTVSFSGIEAIDTSASSSAADILGGKSFEGWDGGNDYSEGTATVVIDREYVNPWDKQFQKAGLTLTAGHNYSLSFKASAPAERKIVVNVANTEDYSTPVASSEFTIGATETEVKLDFVATAVAEGKAAVQINLGKIDDTEAGNAQTTLTFYDITVIDQDAGSGEEDEVERVKKSYDFTSGRVSTQNKHDFVYGYYEARARVPEGMGYLPAFWLMATDEGEYGEWPKCGEVDIMEVMGQNIQKSYHTIHYGYDSGSGHREGQSTKLLEDGDFSNEFHTFGLDWEPGELIWYVDGVEVGRQTEWYSGSSDEDRLSYPAPFDHQFYVILNLAVGGSWVGYPDQAVVDDMENQNYEIDYVRVYQKDAKTYAAAEAKLKEPEPEEVKYREADSTGNYVVNGDFSQELKEMDSDEENFELHLESDCEGSQYVLQDGEIVITPDQVGAETYSVQLKQTGIPMYKGWEYELTFDAYAEEARTIIVDVEGPKRGYTRYLKDTTIELTTESQPYTLSFTMNEKTDNNGSLEFNLGQQGSTAPVHISNVRLTHKSGEEIIDVFEKSVGKDGNYVYNGKFEQGEGRLRYWDIDKTANKTAKVSVTNDLSAEGVRTRELSVKVEVPKGATELKPVIVSQSELAPIGTGSYVLSFDAYSTSGNKDGIKAVVAGKKYKPTLTGTKKSYTYNIKFNSGLTREESEVKFLFTKPGTYYIDNVVLTEAALIKNGYLDAGMAGYTSGNYGSGAASYGVTEVVDGHTNVMDVNIESVGDADWNIQVKQAGVKLENGKSYRLTFDAMSTEARTISVSMQRDGSADDDWSGYSGDAQFQATDQWKTFTKDFTMEKATDPSSLLSIALGKLNNEEVGAHHVYFDNFSLVELDADGNPVAEAAESKIDKTSDVYKVPTFTGWKTTSKGKMYYVKDKAVKKQWKQIDKKWYYFDADGIMASNEWIEGYWLNKDGSCTYKGKASWCKDDNGWYYMDTKKWYAKNQWQKIDGKWYYFKANGYMAANEYCKGYWLNKNGTWTYEAKASWKKDKVGWYYIDTKGWYAKSASYVIDGKKYNFNAKGYCTNP